MTLLLFLNRVPTGADYPRDVVVEYLLVLDVSPPGGQEGAKPPEGVPRSGTAFFSAEQVGWGGVRRGGGNAMGCEPKNEGKGGVQLPYCHDFYMAVSGSRGLQ